MILQQLGNLETAVYQTEIQEALAYLKDPVFINQEPGRSDIDGDRLFALHQQYQTTPIDAGSFESHRQYIDIQFIVEGTEIICHSHTDFLKTTETYKSDGDYQLYEVPTLCSHIVLREQEFAIFFPQDGHMPANK